jgi:hypothetical protein
MGLVKDSSGRYFMRFVVDTNPDLLPELETEAGIDLGLGHFAVLAEAAKVDSPQFVYRAAEKLKNMQESLSRKRLPGRPACGARDHDGLFVERVEDFVDQPMGHVRGLGSDDFNKAAASGFLRAAGDP